MIEEIDTRESLRRVLERGRGYLYDDTGGPSAASCPIHRVDCPHIGRLLAVPAGKLRARKIWSDGLFELVKWIEARGKPSSRCETLQ